MRGHLKGNDHLSSHLSHRAGRAGGGRGAVGVAGSARSAQEIPSLDWMRFLSTRLGSVPVEAGAPSITTLVAGEAGPR